MEAGRNRMRENDEAGNRATNPNVWEYQQWKRGSDEIAKGQRSIKIWERVGNKGVEAAVGLLKMLALRASL